jgi:hypothetical protein
VTAINDAPVATGNTVVADEDVPLVIDAADFLFTDAETDSLASVTITGLNLNGGTLTHSAGAVTVTNGMTVTAAQLADLTFTSAANDHTDSSFTYTVNDADTGVVSAVMNITVNPVNDPPAGLPTITGTPQEDETLTANTGGITDEEGVGAFSYQWKRDGSDISGANGSTYTLTQADVGTTITVDVSYTDGESTAELVSSAGVGPIANLNDDPTGSVTISGTPTEDSTLTAANTLADEDGMGVVFYQWQRDGVDIGGATGSTYTLTQADVGSTITVDASYTDGESTALLTSSAVLSPSMRATPTARAPRC